MQSKLEGKSVQKAERLRAKVARLNSGFKRQFPLLSDFVDGLRPLEDCSMAYFRERVRAHLKLMKQLNGEASRLELSSQAVNQRN